MNGLYLQGGGLKGAFQAGALAAIVESGVTFDVLAGTSIGAINGLVVYYGQEQYFDKLWTKRQPVTLPPAKEAVVIDPQPAISSVQSVVKGQQKAKTIQHFYVNYIEVNQGRPIHRTVDLVGMSLEQQCAYVRYSAMLPKPAGLDLSMSSAENVAGGLDEYFRQALGQGIYDGMCLDGGLLNNQFIEPFVEKKVDRLYLVVFDSDYTLDSRLEKMYGADCCVVIKPLTAFLASDTFNLDPAFSDYQFAEGYRVAKQLCQVEE